MRRTTTKINTSLLGGNFSYFETLLGEIEDVLELTIAHDYKHSWQCERETEWITFSYTISILNCNLSFLKILKLSLFRI